MNGFRMKDIRRIHRDGNGHFFDRAALRFFDSRIERGVYQGVGGVFFITSEQFHGSQGSEPRKYTVRKFEPESGDVHTFGQFNIILTLAEARSQARLCASGLGERVLEIARQHRRSIGVL